MLRIAGITAALVFVVSLMVRSTIKNASKKNIQDVYIKILLNHLQMLLITSAFQLNWPSELSTFLTASAPVTEATTSIVSFDCWMNQRNPADINRYKFTVSKNDMTVVYQKMMMTGGLPIVIGIITVLVWSVILKKYK